MWFKAALYKRKLENGIKTAQHLHLTDAFIQSDLQLHSGYTFFISTCVPWESNPQPFALLTQCSTTEPHKNTLHKCLNTGTNAATQL